MITGYEPSSEPTPLDPPIFVKYSPHPSPTERESFDDNLLVRIHCIIVMTG